MDQPLAKRGSVDGTTDAQTPAAPNHTHDVGCVDGMADPDLTSGRSPAFQFYPKDFITAERVIMMSLAERGAYITLICQCWSEGSLPADVEVLARICGAPVSAFRKLWPALAPCFREDRLDASRLIHPRLEREFQKQKAYRRRQADNGRKGGRPPKPEKPTANPSLLSVPKVALQKESFDLILSGSGSGSQSIDKDVPANARSKHPVFKGRRFVVFDWMLEDLCRILGPHVEAFDLHAWFFELDERADRDGLVVPQRDGGQWLQAETFAEAKRRGLKIATSDPSSSLPKVVIDEARMARLLSEEPL